MPNKDLYIVTYSLCVGAFSPDDSFYYGPSSLKACEAFIEHQKNVVCDVTYYKVKPVKGRYIWKETNDDTKIKEVGEEIDRNLQESMDYLKAVVDSYNDEIYARDLRRCR